MWVTVGRGDWLGAHLGLGLCSPGSLSAGEAVLGGAWEQP